MTRLLWRSLRSLVIATSWFDSLEVSRRPPVGWAARWAANHLTPWATRAAYREGVHVVNDVQMIIPRPPDWGGGGEFHMALGTYERHVLQMLRRRLRPGDGFVDVGAHIGYFTLPVARTVGHLGCVIAIEPHPRSFRILSNNVLLNGFTNIITVHAAASNRSGTVYMFLSEHSDMWSQVVSDTTSLESDRIAEVESRTVDEILAEINWPRIRAIKVDTEGHELQVLEGCAETLSRNRDAFIMFEVSGVNSSMRNTSMATVDYLAQRGYNFFLPCSPPKPISLQEIFRRLNRSRWQETLFNLIAERA